MIGLTMAVQLGFRRYFNFRTRATRSEFWWWVLFTIVSAIVLTVLVDVTLGTYDRESKEGLISGIFRAIVFIPSISIGARRLHDVNRSGWWQLMWLISWLIVPLIILIVWFSRQGDRQTNQYGLSPIMHD